jgi:integrase
LRQVIHFAGVRRFGEVRKQAEVYLLWVKTRDREPIKDTSSMEAALNKWILPAIGDLSLGSVNNITVKPLVDRVKKSRSARSVNTYIEYIQQIVASFKDGETGEPIHRRKWDSSVMDLPLVNSKQQRRPSLKAKAVDQLVRESEGEEQALYVLAAATGMRISEALALERKHFINNGRTIEVQQQVDRETLRIVSYLKTEVASRQIDLCPNVAEYPANIHRQQEWATVPDPKRHAILAQQPRVPVADGAPQNDGARRAGYGLARFPQIPKDVATREALPRGHTSTIFGWGTSRKQCPNSIRAWMKNSNSDSMKRK